MILIGCSIVETQFQLHLQLRSALSHPICEFLCLIFILHLLRPLQRPATMAIDHEGRRQTYSAMSRIRQPAAPRHLHMLHTPLLCCNISPVTSVFISFWLFCKKNRPGRALSAWASNLHLLQPRKLLARLPAAPLDQTAPHGSSATLVQNATNQVRKAVG